MMRAVVFEGSGRLVVCERPVPVPGPGEAVIRVTLTTICGTDVHIVKGDYPVPPGLILGHEPVGVIESLGPGLDDEYRVGQRVIVGAITPCGQCFDCLNHVPTQCRNGEGGWRLGRSLDGAWAEFMLVPDARANMAPIPDGLADEDVLLASDVFSAGVAAAERGGVRLGDSVAVFAQGPLGLCATLGAKLLGAAWIVAVDTLPERLERAYRFGANVVVDARGADPVAEIRRLTGGRGVDVAIEALGMQITFENALRAIRRGGTLSSLGVYAGKLQVPVEPFHAGLGDQTIVTSLCPGGKERMRRLMAMIAARRVDLTPLITHRFALEEIEAAYDLFSHQRDGVMKVTLQPGVKRHGRDRLDALVAAPMDDCC